MIKQALTNASREAGRTAALITTLDDDRADTAARDRLRGTIYWVSDPDRTRVTITPGFEDGVASGTAIDVVVEVDCEDISWIPPFFFAGAKIQGNCTTFRE